MTFLCRKPDFCRGNSAFDFVRGAAALAFTDRGGSPFPPIDRGGPPLPPIDKGGPPLPPLYRGGSGSSSPLYPVSNVFISCHKFIRQCIINMENIVFLESLTLGARNTQYRILYHCLVVTIDNFSTLYFFYIFRQ